MHDAMRRLEEISRQMSQSYAVYKDLAFRLPLSTSATASLQDLLAKQCERDRNLFGATSAVLSQVRLMNLATSNSTDLALANEHLTDLVSRAAIANSSLSKIFAEHNVLRASVESLATRSSITNLLSSLDTTRLLHTSLSSQYRLLGLEASSLGRLVGASSILANDLTAIFGKLTRSYRNVVECLPQIPQRHIPLLATHSPVEYAMELNVLERISVDEDSEPDADVVDSLPTLDAELASFDERLLILINGAREALRTENPDMARHVTTSTRELFTHIIHGLAPDAEVKKWSADPSHFYDNRPTRRARLLYICRAISSDPLAEFVEDDVRAALTLVDSLNAGTHVVQSKLTVSQLEAIVYRMESLALFLLRISREA